MFPDLTVVIPVWGNYWHYLEELLTCLAQQQVPSEKIIILGNGETVPSTFQGKGWICRSSPEQLSIGGIRNYLLDEIDTAYILYCDADDLIADGALSLLMKHLRTHPRSVAALGYNQLSNGQRYSWPAASDFTHRPLSLIFRQLAWNRFYLATGAVLQVQALQELGGFPEIDLAEDGGAAAALLAVGRISFLPVATRVYRVHPSGLCQRGHSRLRWRQAYREQRLWLADNHALPKWLRVLVPFYAPLHYCLAIRLENRARYDNT